MAANQHGSSTFPFVLGQVDDGTFTRNVSQTFLTQSATLASFFANAADRIFFFGAYPGPLGGPTGEVGQLATTNFVYEDAANTFFDGANANKAGRNWEIDVHQYIGFTERKFADATNTFFNPFNVPEPSRAALTFKHDVTDAFSWNDHSEMGDAAKRVYPISNTIGFSQELLNTPDVDDLFQTVFATTGQSIDTIGTDFGGDTAQTFLRQHVAFRIQGITCKEKEYTPFVGESDDSSYPEVSTTAPSLGSGVLTLTHPRVTPTLTLVLKNPDFGNSDVLRFTKVDRRLRGGERKIYSDLEWGSSQTFELTITNICATNVTVDNILDFLNTSLGEEIGLLDWEGRQWKGIIVAPETDVTPTVGGHSLRLVFEGELV